MRVEQVSDLITQKLTAMTDAENYRLLRSRHKAITALLPYAVREERDGRPEMFDAFLHAARAARLRNFVWKRVKEIVATLISEASPRAIVLASPYFNVYQLTAGSKVDFIREWAQSTSVVPHTEEVGQSVVDVLLQLGSNGALTPYIPSGVWSWLKERPYLSPICWGCYFGTRDHVVKTVRALNDVEVLKSYFLLLWSEWGPLQDTSGFSKMCTSLREDFCGAEMSHHRTELLRRLDHILGQLGLGLERLKQENPHLDREDLRRMKRRYRKLKEVLLEVGRRTLFSKYPEVPHADSMEMSGILCNICVYASFPYPQFRTRNRRPSRPSYPPSLYSLRCFPSFFVDLAIFLPDSPRDRY